MLILLINYLKPWGTLLTLLEINFMVNHADHNCCGNCFLRMIFCMNQARVDHSGAIGAMLLCARGGRGFRGFLSSFPSVFILSMKSMEQALQTCGYCKLDTNKRNWSLGPFHISSFTITILKTECCFRSPFSAHSFCAHVLYTAEKYAWRQLLDAVCLVLYFMFLSELDCQVFFFLLSATAHITVCYNEL